MKFTFRFRTFADLKQQFGRNPKTTSALQLICLCGLSMAVGWYIGGRNRQRRLAEIITTFDAYDPINSRALRLPQSSTALTIRTAQRDQTWRRLNHTLFQLAMLQCRLQLEVYDESVLYNTARSGAYCDRHTSHVTDWRLVKYLRKLLRGRIVAGFGDGNGVYASALVGSVKRYDSYDGAWFSTVDSNYSVKFVDLSMPIYGLPRDYDTVVSLEVAEHIPRRFERHFLDNLVRYAKRAIVLSWAVPGQIGYAHVNGRTAEYVMWEMERRGFRLDLEISDRLKENADFWWLKENLNYYQRRRRRKSY